MNKKILIIVNSARERDEVFNWLKVALDSETKVSYGTYMKINGFDIAVVNDEKWENIKGRRSDYHVSYANTEADRYLTQCGSTRLGNLQDAINLIKRRSQREQVYITTAMPTENRLMIEKEIEKMREGIMTPSGNFRVRYDEMYGKEILNNRFGVPPMLRIKNVIFNDPATIVMWFDGTKTVVKAGEGEAFDPEKGLAMAISKKMLGNKGNYYDVFRKWLPKESEGVNLTTRDAANILGISIDDVRNAIARGEIPGAKKVSGKWQIPALKNPDGIFSFEESKKGE